VLATDISHRVPGKSARGGYPIEKFQGTSHMEYLRSYMLKGRGERSGVMKVRPELHTARSAVCPG